MTYLPNQLTRYCILLFCLLSGVHTRAHSANAAENVAVVAEVNHKECVIGLHGLARTARSMEKALSMLIDSGFSVANIGYPSRELNIQELATPAIEKGLSLCRQQNAPVVHFVTHSLGGILVRQYLSRHSIENLGRVVMLAPPNQGSEIVDKLRDVPGFKLLNGPAGLQLGTGADSVPLMLGPVDFDLGVMAGTRTINLFLSTLLPNPDDGKVSAARTLVGGMCDFMTVDVAHPFIMKDDNVIRQVSHYLKHGYFKPTNETSQRRLIPAKVRRPDHCT